MNCTSASPNIVSMKKNNSVKDKALLLYFPLAMLYQVLMMFYLDTHLVLPLQALTLLYGLWALGRIKYNNNFKSIVVIFIIYSILSVVFVIGSKLIDGFVYDVRVVILPMFTIFIGMWHDDNMFYKFFIYSVSFCMGLGLLLYLIRPGWYLSYLVDCYNNAWYNTSAVATEDNIMSGQLGWAYRFCGIYSTPYAISYFATFALCLLAVDIYREESTRLITKRWVQWVCFIVLALAAILCQNRVAMIYTVFIIAVALIYGIKVHNKARHFFTGLIVTVILVGTFIFIRYQNDDFFVMLKETLSGRVEEMKLSNLENSSRSSQIQITLKSWNNVPFGEGLGSRGGVARSLGAPGITDNGYIKLLVEQGVLGFCILLVIFLKSALRALRRYRLYAAELLMIGYVLFTLIGANTLGMSYDFMIIMWYAVGRIWNKKYLQTGTKYMIA